MYPLAARCLISLMYASIPAWGRPYMPVRISEMSLFLLIGQRFYSSMMSSGMDHAGMYMYQYSIMSLNGVMRYIF